MFTPIPLRYFHYGSVLSNFNVRVRSSFFRFYILAKVPESNDIIFWFVLKIVYPLTIRMSWSK